MSEAEALDLICMKTTTPILETFSPTCFFYSILFSAPLNLVNLCNLFQLCAFNFQTCVRSFSQLSLTDDVLWLC